MDVARWRDPHWGTLIKRLDPLESPTVFCSAYKGNMLKKAGW